MQRTTMNKIQRKSALLGPKTDSHVNVLKYNRTLNPTSELPERKQHVTEKKSNVAGTLDTTLLLISNAEKNLSSSQVRVLENESISIKAENEMLKKEKATFLAQKEQISSIMQDMESNIRKLQIELNEYKKDNTSSANIHSDIAVKAELQHLKEELKKTKEEKNAAEQKVKTSQSLNERLSADLKNLTIEKNAEARAAIEALKTQLSQSLKEIETLKCENLQLKKENTNLEYLGIQHQLSSGANTELQKQLDNANKVRKQTEEKVSDLVDRTTAQLEQQKILNDQLTAKNQELQIDVEILIEELELKETDIEGLVEDNNAMFEKLKQLGISPEYDNISGRLVFI